MECVEKAGFEIFDEVAFFTGIAVLAVDSAGDRNLSEDVCGFFKTSVIQKLFAFMGKSFDLVFEFRFEFGAPAAGVSESAVLQIGALFYLTETIKDGGELAFVKGIFECVTAIEKMLFESGGLCCALIAAAAVLVPDPDFAAAIEAAVDERGAAVWRETVTNICGDWLIDECIVNDAARSAESAGVIWLIVGAVRRRGGCYWCGADCWRLRKSCF